MSIDRRQQMADQVADFPDQPGVYLFRDAGGGVLYVGKASSLLKRARSYFQSPAALTTRTMKMLEAACDVDCIVTDNEVEALILESNLIKRHRPRYNVRLRDDKHYPYVQVTTGEEFPRVRIVRRTDSSQHRYFGPFTETRALRKTLEHLRKVFPYRTCSNWRMRRTSRPCLHFQTDRCLAPCTGEVSEQEYGEMMEGLVRFFSGYSDDIVKQLRREMEGAADNLEFERAGQLRDKIRALEHVSERQKMLSASSAEDEDYLGIAHGGNEACVTALFVREGKLVGREHFLMADTKGTDDAEILEAFLRDYYSDAPLIPGRVEVPVTLSGTEALQQWLCEQREGRVVLHRPQRGRRRRLMRLACRNAELQLSRADEKVLGADSQAAIQLAEVLGLPAPPSRIEGYDISVLSGTAAVGSMVVFENGAPARYAYRRFRIKDSPKDSDTAMLTEILDRRFSRLMQTEDADARAGDSSFSSRPDLVLVDGGIGQVGAAREVLADAGLDIRICGLAKREELIYLPEEADPVDLSDRSPALQLLQQVRDEAHRFAQDYHHRLRRSTSIRSLLDDIPGIGPKRRRVLLRHFDSLQEIAGASQKQLAELDGMTSRAARSVHDFLADYLR